MRLVGDRFARRDASLGTGIRYTVWDVSRHGCQQSAMIRCTGIRFGEVKGVRGYGLVKG